jgi:RHS repeat-associated protein
MHVASGQYSGTFEILYKAASTGQLKWGLKFTADVAGQYQLTYSWSNVTRHNVLQPHKRSFGSAYDSANYTFDWSDVPSSFNVGPSLSSDNFSFVIQLGAIGAGRSVSVDPTIASNVGNGATAFTFERKIVYNSQSGYYFAFYHNGITVGYSSSPDGINWSTQQSMPSGWPGYYDDPSNQVAVLSAGQTVVVASGQYTAAGCLGNCITGVHPYVYFVLGTMSGGGINWQTVQYFGGYAPTCQSNGSVWCHIYSGYRYVNIAWSSTGVLVFSYNWWEIDQNDVSITCQNYQTSYLLMNYNNNIFEPQAIGGSYPTCSSFATMDNDRSILIPADSNGKVRIIYQYAGTNSAPSLLTTWYDGTTTGPTDTIQSTVPDNDQFSAVADTNYGQHLVYPGLTDGTVAYTYKASIGSLWATTPSLFESAIGSVYAPTITVDYSTNNLYVLALLSHGGPWSVVMKSKTLSQNWSDQLTVVPVTGTGTPPAYLSSASISASATNNAQIAAIWTQQTCPCSVAFASIPIQTVWSPFSTPPLPWDGNGLAPYGQYFSNLGEYVSPSLGTLTIRQTDLSLAGRGINLEITRVYTEPYSFLNCGTSCQPYLYESYPWAPIGAGWQLNFPWMNSSPQPSYLHVSNGQGYLIPSSFWTGSTATFENHRGENFRLVRFVNATIVLYDRSGTAYSFGTSPNHALTSITDSTGNNTITFNYSNNLISCISDAVQRPFSFTYSGAFLQKISEVNGSCASPGSTIRSVTYGNNGASLTSVTDPANRVTTYSPGSNPWLISQITYPTSWYDSYTYTQTPLGTQATSFRVSLQQIMVSSTSTVRQFAYSYTKGVGDQITGTTVTSYNGTQIAAYTKYGFSFLADIKNVTDANGNLLSGDEQFFGVNGQIPKDVVLVSDGQGHLGSYTNYYSYDLWGNTIYSRRSINPLSNSFHESYNAYYNNAEPPGFSAFQDSFSGNGGTTPDNSWNVTAGNWLVSNGVYNGTATSGDETRMFAWADIGKPDVSIQARVYVARQVNASFPRIGILTHFPKTGSFKWGLVFYSGSLYLLDEWNVWLTGVPCPLNTGIWYTLNMTVSGFTATGWASAQGQATCRVAGTFPTNSPAAGGTAFGLYAGAYSALFDDVQVTTASPFITGSGFSNSFVQNGAPGPVGLNTWLTTTKPPSQGWNTAPNWLPASAWSQAYPSQNYGSAPWGTITGWPDTNAQWIWATTNADVSASLDPVWFRRIFTVSTSATLNVAITVDNTYVVYLDGSSLGTGNNWQQVGSYTSTIGPGYHVLAINATNTGGPAGLLVSVKNTGTGQVIFRTDATAGPVISALAGSGQLQNGASSSPIETYYSYYPWGGLNQTRQLYYPPAAPVHVDGVSTGFTWNNAKETTTLSTSNSNDLIILSIYGDSDGAITSVTDNANLVWKQRFNQWVQYEYYAISSSPLSSDTITVTFQSFTSTPGLIAFGITGYNYTNPFDPSISIPAGYDATTNNPSVTITLSGSNEMVLGNLGTNGCGVFSTGSGFTPLTEIGGSIAAAAEYEIASGTVTVTGSFAACGGTPHTAVIADAILPSNPTWITTSKKYNVYGNPTSITDPRGNVTVYGYSQQYRAAYVTSQNQTLVPGGTLISQRYTYNFTLGTVLAAVDPNGYNTTYQYDILGRGTRVNHPGGLGYTSYVYNDQANYLDTTNENGWHSRQIYDGLGRLTLTERFLGTTTYNETYRYNWQNKLTMDRDSLGNANNYTYDALGRSTAIIKPDKTAVLYFYDDTGSWVRVADENGNYQCDVYDRMSRLDSVIENASSNCLTGIVSNYYYSEVGSLVKQVNANQQATIYTYDNLGRLSQTNYPDRTFASYTYDSDGNLIKKVDQKQYATLYSYDSISRLSVVSYCGPPVVGTTISSQSYTYDKDSNLVQLQNKNATLTYAYDARSRTLSEKYAVNAGATTINLGCVGTNVPSTNGSSLTYTIGYGYNGEVLGNVTYPDGLIVRYNYDSLGRVITVSKSGSQTNYAMFSYYNCPCSKRVKGISFGDGTIGNYTYDGLTRPTNITLVNVATKLLSLSYTYGKTGVVSNVTGQVNGASINEQYQYDQLNRLTGATLNDGGTTNTFSYKYDTVGNRLSQTLNGATTAYNITQANNELVSSSATGIVIGYSYDPNGNLANRNVTTSGTVNWKYAWSFSNQLVQVSNNNGAQGTYAYDGKGRRAESVESSTTFYAYLGTETLYEKFVGGATNDYVYAHAFRIAKISGTTANYYHDDALGSTRLVTAPGKKGTTVAFSNNYQPFGQDNGTPTGSETYKFTGKPYSIGTGLYYEFQRWYDPATGRFLSQDPAAGQLSNPQSLNPYIYVDDSPTSHVDPSGLDTCNAWNPFTYGGCINNEIQTINNVVVQPAESFVNKNIVQPIVKKIITPIVDKVVVPIVRDIIVPLVKQTISIAQNAYNTLTNVGSTLWQGAQNVGQQVYQGLKGAADYIASHPNKVIACAEFAAILIALAIGGYEAFGFLTAVSAEEAAAAAAEGGLDLAGAGGPLIAGGAGGTIAGLAIAQIEPGELFVEFLHLMANLAIECFTGND